MKLGRISVLLISCALLLPTPHLFAIGEAGDDLITAPVPDRLVITVETAEFLAPIFDYQHIDAEEIVSIAFSHNSRVLAAIDDDGLINLLDTTTGEVWNTLDVGRSTVGEIVFSVDSRMLLVETHRSVQVWDVVRGDMVREFGGYGSPVQGLALSPDGEILAVAHGDVLDDRDYVVRLWDWRAGRQVGLLDGLTSYATAVAYHPAGRYVAAGDSFGVIRVWDVSDLQDPDALGVFFWDNPLRIYDIEFTADGNYLVSSGIQRDNIHFWNIDTGGLDFTVDVGINPETISLNPSTTVLATAPSPGNSEGVTLWDAQSGERLSMVTSEDTITAMTFSPDGTLLATGGHTGHITIWGLLEQ